MTRNTFKAALRAACVAGLITVASADVRISASADVQNLFGAPSGAYSSVALGDLVQLSIRVAEVGTPGPSPSAITYDLVPAGSSVQVGSASFAFAAGTVEVDHSGSSATLIAACDLVGGGEFHLIFVDTTAPLMFSSNVIGQLLGTYLISETSTHAFGANFPGGGGISMLGVTDVRISDFEPAVGSVYCPGVVNSTGAQGHVEALGQADAAANDLRLRASGLPGNAAGFFLASRAQGLFSQPGGSLGDLCLGSPIGRFVGPGQVQNSGAAGEFSLQLDLTQMPTPTGSVAVTAGETWNFQSWYRDTVGGTAVSNFTSALSVTFL
ncbi:MAG: hypothetical protein R3F49_23365 [Planctomycetota bacterium]